MEITMYDSLLQLPLFQGLGKNDFTRIIEKVKLHFKDFKQGSIIAEQNTPCEHLIFLLKGEINMQRIDEANSYILSETITVPDVFEPQSIFGMHTRYMATYMAQTDVKAMSIEKNFILKELNKHEIFRLNYLNYLSVYCQTYNNKLWNFHIGSIEQKFLQFFLSRCRRPYGPKHLKITMEVLANLIDETRINVSRLLNELQQKDLVTLKRKGIFIPDLASLTEYLQYND